MMIIEMYKFFLFYKPKGRRGYKKAAKLQKNN